MLLPSLLTHLSGEGDHIDHILFPVSMTEIEDPFIALKSIRNRSILFPGMLEEAWEGEAKGRGTHPVAGPKTSSVATSNRYLGCSGKQVSFPLITRSWKPDPGPICMPPCNPHPPQPEGSTELVEILKSKSSLFD